MRLKYLLILMITLFLVFSAQLGLAKSGHHSKKAYKTKHHSKRQTQHQTNHHKQSKNAVDLHSLNRANTKHDKKSSIANHQPQIKPLPTPVAKPVPTPQNPLDILIDKTAQQVKQEARIQLEQ